MNNNTAPAINWPLWKKFLFRFLFIWIVLNIAPVTWLNSDLNIAGDYYLSFTDWLTYRANAAFFHIREELVYLNGSGDTSFSWAQQLLFLVISIVGCLLWSLLDYKRKNYERLDYWLRTFVRYYVIYISVTYGAMKLFMLQMPFPSYSQMATPLGDLSPMRLAWMFLGYSGPYEMFSGIMEIMVAVLLLFRRTMTAGLLLGVFVYFNVFMLNMGYDICVKVFSLHNLFYCLFLLAYQWRRIASFFFLNKVAMPYAPYIITYPKKWMRITKHVVKGLFIVLFFMAPIADCMEMYSVYSNTTEPEPFYGIYNMYVYMVNGDTICSQPEDSTVWRDIVFDHREQGSIGARDSLFRQRYGRSYFGYTVDTVDRNIVLTSMKSFAVPDTVCVLDYQSCGADTLIFNTIIRSDSIHIEAVRRKQPYRLMEKEFSWLQESPQ